MTPETLTALKASIAHHEENLKAEMPGEVKLGVSHCALCTIHRDVVCGGILCFGCPVMGRTRRHGCDGSPYDEVMRSFERWEWNTKAPNKRTFLAAERAEIEFLRSLLPEEHV